MNLTGDEAKRVLPHDPNQQTHRVVGGQTARQRVLILIYRTIAVPVYATGSLLGLILYAVNTSANAALRPRIYRAFGVHSPLGEVERTLRAYWQAAIYEKLDMLGLSLAMIAGIGDALFEIRGLDYIDTALHDRRGALIAFIHMANAQCCLVAISLSYPDIVHTIVHYTPERATGLRRGFRQWFWQKALLPGFNGRITHPSDLSASLKGIRALNNNGIVLLAADVAWRKANGIKVMLMGADMELPLGCVFFAEQTGAPLFLMQTERGRGRWRHIITISAPILLPEDQDKSVRLRHLTDLVDVEIRKNPAEWRQW